MKDFQEIFMKNKLNNAYFDKEQDAYLQEAYYLRMKELNYENLNGLIFSTFNHARSQIKFLMRSIPDPHLGPLNKAVWLHFGYRKL